MAGLNRFVSNAVMAAVSAREILSISLDTHLLSVSLFWYSVSSHRSLYFVPLLPACRRLFYSLARRSEPIVDKVLV